MNKRLKYLFITLAAVFCVFNLNTTDQVQAKEELKVKVKKVSVSTTVQISKPRQLQTASFPLPKGTYYFNNDFGGARPGDRNHQGIDIIAKKGTKIKSVNSGRVYSSGWDNLGGWTVTVKSGNYYIYYAHLMKKSHLKKGQVIKRNQLVGYVGRTGYSTKKGAQIKGSKHHLHFSIYKGRWNAINPYTNLKWWEYQNYNTTKKLR